MLRAIANAQREIYLATYIFHTDSQAQALAIALNDAAARGDQVRVVVDGFGSLSSIPTLKHWWNTNAVSWVIFRPLDRWLSWLQPEYLRRLHQKLCVVDESVAFVGGINIIDDRVDTRLGVLAAPRLDYAVEVSGPVLVPITQTLKAIWSRAAWGADWRDEILQMLKGPRPWAYAKALVRQMRLSLPRSNLLNSTSSHAYEKNGKMAFVWRDNMRQRHSIERILFQAFSTARLSIDVISPYFYPGRRLRSALRKAAQRGIKVRLLLQGNYDYAIAKWASSAVHTELLASGVQIFEYTPAFLHAKVVCIDGLWATIGSSNLDPLSLMVNYEANVIMCDSGFIAILEENLKTVFNRSEQIKLDSPQYISNWKTKLHKKIILIIARIYLRLSGTHPKDSDY